MVKKRANKFGQPPRAPAPPMAMPEREHFFTRGVPVLWVISEWAQGLLWVCSECALSYIEHAVVICSNFMLRHWRWAGRKSKQVTFLDHKS